jgi:hypothetical protein
MFKTTRVGRLVLSTPCGKHVNYLMLLLANEKGGTSCISSKLRIRCTNGDNNTSKRAMIILNYQKIMIPY